MSDPKRRSLFDQLDEEVGSKSQSAGMFGQLEADLEPAQDAGPRPMGQVMEAGPAPSFVGYDAPPPPPKDDYDRYMEMAPGAIDDAGAQLRGTLGRAADSIGEGIQDGFTGFSQGLQMGIPADLAGAWDQSARSAMTGGVIPNQGPQAPILPPEEVRSEWNGAHERSPLAAGGADLAGAFMNPVSRLAPGASSAIESGVRSLGAGNDLEQAGIDAGQGLLTGGVIGAVGRGVSKVGDLASEAADRLRVPSADIGGTAGLVARARQGFNDADLNYIRHPDSFRDMGPFRDAYAAGADPNAVAKQFPPIDITHGDTGWALRDGRHRLTAAREAGADSIPATVSAWDDAGENLNTIYEGSVPLSRSMPPPEGGRDLIPGFMKTPLAYAGRAMGGSALGTRAAIEGVNLLGRGQAGIRNAAAGGLDRVAESSMIDGLGRGLSSEGVGPAVGAMVSEGSPDTAARDSLMSGKGHELETNLEQILYTDPGMLGKYRGDFEFAGRNPGGIGALLRKLESQDATFRATVLPVIRGGAQ